MKLRDHLTRRHAASVQKGTPEEVLQQIHKTLHDTGFFRYKEDHTHEEEK